MPPADPEAAALTVDDFEFHDEEEALGGTTRPSAGINTQQQPIPTRSPYHLPASEQLRGVANRIIFSRYYIFFYLIMMGLSLATIALSLISRHGCPPLAWHVLEFIINGFMVIEVGTRWVAYGKKYPLTPLNIIDLVLVLFCVITLLLVINSPCSDGTRSEENLDLILLIVRNGVQFLRLFNILRRSGHSLFNPPKPIDLSQARSASRALNLDLDDDEAFAEQQLHQGSANFPARTLSSGGGGTGNRYEPIFTDADEDNEAEVGAAGSGRSSTGTSNDRKPLNLTVNQGRQNLTQEDEDAWDRLG